jgi:hypothetical protein
VSETPPDLHERPDTSGDTDADTGDGNDRAREPGPDPDTSPSGGDGVGDGPDTPSDLRFDTSDTSDTSSATSAFPDERELEQLRIDGGSEPIDRDGQPKSKVIHRATYSKELLPHMGRALAAWGLPVHDCFAGTGEKLGRLCDELGLTFTGTEIEEPLIVDPHVRAGDATDPASYPSGEFVVMTSPTYGNGCNDDFVWRGPDSKNKHNTYRHWLSETVGHDQPLHKNNTGKYGVVRRGPGEEARYWALNRAAVAHWPDRVIVNCKDFTHHNTEIYPLVAKWTALLEEHGYVVRDPVEVPCPSLKYGANRDRVKTEALLVAERPDNADRVPTIEEPARDPRRFTR